MTQMEDQIGTRMQPAHARCMRCHRALKNERSRAIGYGPVCQARVVKEIRATKEEQRTEEA